MVENEYCLCHLFYCDFQPFIQQAYEEADNYREPDERIKAIDRFVKRLSGEEISDDEMSEDRETLWDKAAKLVI